MALHLDRVIPWGRSKTEYFVMFGLDESSLNLRILGCADGPASLNAEMTERGGSVISVDPIYCFSGQEIKQRFKNTVEDVIGQVKASPDKWVWKFHRDPDGLRNHRVAALNRFLADYDLGKAAGRYVAAELPPLPFPNDQFDLALCSHFLFLYSDLLSEEFHVQSVLEMCRVAREIRIFPILSLRLDTSPYIESLCRAAATKGYRSDICEVDYELQRGGNKMLRLHRSE